MVVPLAAVAILVPRVSIGILRPAAAAVIALQAAPVVITIMFVIRMKLLRVVPAIVVEVVVHALEQRNLLVHLHQDAIGIPPDILDVPPLLRAEAAVVVALKS